MGHLSYRGGGAELLQFSEEVLKLDPVPFIFVPSLCRNSRPSPSKPTVHETLDNRFGNPLIEDGR
jgi:hypothetical protein